MKQWYSIENKADVAEVYIYESIGEDFWGEGLTAKGFLEELSGIKAAQINLHVNSPGGSVFDGQAIYNALQRHPARVTTYVDGVAASIAGVVALAGDEVVMASNALFMVHDPWGMTMGTAEDIRAYADVLDKVRGTIVGVYDAKTNLGDETVSDLMAAETWMTAQEAVDYGFADSIGAEMKAAACAFDYSPFNYKHPPVATATFDEDDGEPDVRPEPEAEAAKDEGMSDLEYLSMSIR